MPNQDPETNSPEELRKAADEKVMDPQDLAYTGGYRGNPRRIVENPAVSPQMLEDVEDFHAGDIRDDDGRDEVDEDIRYL